MRTMEKIEVLLAHAADYIFSERFSDKLCKGFCRLLACVLVLFMVRYFLGF